MPVFGISYWILPLFSAACWFGTLLAMMIVWISQGKPRYSSMYQTQSIAYISDIGATGLKPLFIAGSTVSVVVFTLTFISERWLRHKGRLAHNTSIFQKVLSIISIFAAVVGMLGLILLTIFDTLRHPHLHRTFLGLFIGGYIVSAIFICAEYNRLGKKFQDYKVLSASFWIKLAFIFIEIALVASFGAMSYQSRYNVAAILEWTISLVYILFVASFTLDFLPAVKTKHDRFPTREEFNAAMEEGNGPSFSGGPTFAETGSFHSAQPMMQQTNRGSVETQQMPPRRF